jgi:hypothetical protein
VEIPRKVGPNTWGVRTPLHFNKATGKKERYWIGREYKTKTEAEKALRQWHTDHEAGKIAARSDMRLGLTGSTSGWRTIGRRGRPWPGTR